MTRPAQFTPATRRWRSAFRWLSLAWLIVGSSWLQAQLLPLPLTARDFQVPGTQVGDVTMTNWPDSNQCSDCHANYGGTAEPHTIWAGSLMALGGRDPLFYAQMAYAAAGWPATTNRKARRRSRVPKRSGTAGQRR